MPSPGELQLIEDIIAESTAALAELATLAAEGGITEAQFIMLMREEIKSTYIQQYLIVNGSTNMSQSDWGTLGSLIKEQYKYLDGFAGEIGNLTEAQIKARMDMYINSSRSANAAAMQNLEQANGASMMRWVLGETEDHCEDCLGYVNQGWVTIGELPLPGDGESQCLTNCKCSVEFGTGE